MKGDSGNTAGRAPNTGGPGPRPSRDWKKDGGNQSPSHEENPGHGPAQHVKSHRGYTVLGKSPVQDDPQPYPGQDKHENKGIDIDFDHDGSYTGGTGNGRAS